MLRNASGFSVLDISGAETGLPRSGFVQRWLPCTPPRLANGWQGSIVVGFVWFANYAHLNIFVHIEN